MLNSSNGIPFIQNKTDIPLNCFISAEAVWWCMEHIEDVLCEADAIVFMQILIDFDLVRHISDHFQIIFIHGFYLYYIITEEAIHSQHVFTKVRFMPFLRALSKVGTFLFQFHFLVSFIYIDINSRFKLIPIVFIFNINWLYIIYRKFIIFLNVCGVTYHFYCCCLKLYLKKGRKKML